MELNPYLHYRLSQERSADARRAAEHWRLIQSLQDHGGFPGWLDRVGLSLRRLLLIRSDDGTHETKPRAPETSPRASETSPTPRQTVPSPRL